MIYYDKAIRDKIPEIIQESGYSCHVKTLTDNEFIIEIEKKLKQSSQVFYHIK